MTVVTTSAAAFACMSRACAPPPVGTGGSTGGSGRELRGQKLTWEMRKSRKRSDSNHPRIHILKIGTERWVANVDGRSTNISGRTAKIVQDAIQSAIDNNGTIQSGPTQSQWSYRSGGEVSLD